MEAHNVHKTSPFACEKKNFVKALGVDIFGLLLKPHGPRYLWCLIHDGDH